MEISGGDGDRFLSELSLTFLENIDRRSCNDGSRELIPVFHNPHRKGRPAPSAVALTLEYLVGPRPVGWSDFKVTSSKFDT